MDNQVTTPPAGKTPEEIEREMQQTRGALTEKVAALESQVVGTVQTAADTISGTVEAVKTLVTQAPSTVSDTVKQAASAVGESVKETFDLTGHVRRNPWTALGVSAGVGFLVGLIVFRDKSSPVFAAAPAGVVPSPPGARPASGVAAPSQPGVIDEFIGMIGRKAKELAETALESVSASLMTNIQEGMPKLVNDAAARLTETRSEEHCSPTVAGRFDAGRQMYG